jgi:hypothetical protein
MRGSILVTLLAAACLVAIWTFATGAQVIDATPCEKACYEQESDCVTACGEDTDPVECEGRCEDQLDDCLEQCR